MKMETMRVKLFADLANLQQLLELNKAPYIKGFTTNPTLMRKAGVSNYAQFAKEVLASVTDKPVSFEVFADDLAEMAEQAFEINSWGPNVYVKIPVMNTQRRNCYELIQYLTKAGVKINVTAIFTLEQVEAVVNALQGTQGAIVSVFAGRIADTGVDPVPVMKEALEIIGDNNKMELLWASPRELLNIVQADEVGCHIITATPDIIQKLALLNKDLEQFSLETVMMFYNDALKAGYNIDTPRRANKFVDTALQA